MADRTITIGSAIHQLSPQPSAEVGEVMSAVKYAPTA